MKKYDENDIISMLSKTEKTTPGFDKRIDFPLTVPIAAKRHKKRTFMLAACVSVVMVTTVVTGLIASRETSQATLSDPDYSENVFMSGVSYYPQETVKESFEYSADDSFESDKSRDPYAEITDESSFPDYSESESALPLIAYPDSQEFYNGQGLGKDSTPEEYINTNPHDHLGAMVRLPVYMKNTLDLEECNAMLKEFSNAFSSDFVFDSIYYEEHSAFSGENVFGDTVYISEYGDWECFVNDSGFMSIIIEKGNPEAILGAVERFAIINPGIFGTGDRSLDCVVEENSVSVKLTVSADDEILSKLSVYTFDFERNGSVCTLKYLSHQAGNAVSVGKYEIRLYESAVRALFEERFIGEYGFEFSENGEFIISAYDVRYLQSENEAMICPYYVFVIEVEPYSDHSRYETVFIPAVADEYLENNQVD